ncbi:MAG: uroporphyrinogen decarboxylase family protein [Gemmatimonadota bacterium]
MDSRERTFLALSFQEPDRVPVDCWMSAGFEDKLRRVTGETRLAFLDRHDVDLRYIDGPRYVGPPLRRFRDGTDEDIWGVRRQVVQVDVGGGRETYHEVSVSPLAGVATPEEVEAHGHWPSPDWFDYTPVEAQCRAIRDQGRVAVFQGDRLNRLAQLKPAMYLRGVERIFLDLVERPAVARAVIGRIRRFYLEYAERLFAAAAGQLDLVLTGDDFGSQRGPLMSPAMWRDFLGEGFAAYTDLAHASGLQVMHHTCGSVRPLIPDLLDRGLDVLQSLQPEAEDMDPARLKVQFGRRLAFHGGISVQHTLPHGAPADVRREVALRLAALGVGGGYILGTSHNLQADVPLENAEALFRAYRELGRYR